MRAWEWDGRERRGEGGSGKGCEKCKNQEHPEGCKDWREVDLEALWCTDVGEIPGRVTGDHIKRKGLVKISAVVDIGAGATRRLNA